MFFCEFFCHTVPKKLLERFFGVFEYMVMLENDCTCRLRIIVPTKKNREKITNSLGSLKKLKKNKVTKELVFLFQE